jgi:sec-independent protein translocase protein TatC
MFLLAIPMGVLYLAACAVAWLHDHRLARRLAAASSTTTP